MSVQTGLYGGIAALELAGGYFASQNIKETAKLNKKISDFNSQFAELDAYDALAEGKSEQARYQSVIDNTLAEQSVIQSAQNIDANYGSSSSIKEETKFQARLNLMEIEKQAQRQALGFTRQARDIRLQSNLEYQSSKARASQAMFGSAIGAAKTGITGYERNQ